MFAAPPVLESSFCNNLLRLKESGFAIPAPLVARLRKWVDGIESKLRLLSSDAGVIVRFHSTLARFHEVLDAVGPEEKTAKY
jgi:hypothetical protein